MIQDIEPHKLDNGFAQTEAEEAHVFFAVEKGKVLAKKQGDDWILPAFSQLSGSFEEWKNKAIYVFAVDKRPMFLILQKDLKGEMPEGFAYVEPRELYQSKESWMALAAVTAKHLDHWYVEHRYCGCCGAVMDFSKTERAMVCPECRNIQYPRISPVIMAAIVHGDEILVTRYADRPYKGMALIAGFVEIGESLEGALQREVMEEVGLKVKDITYFGSQPWGFSDSIISGFFARLDGDRQQVRLDRDELSEAVWISREDLPEQKSHIAITSAMLEAFRKGQTVI